MKTRVENRQKRFSTRVIGGCSRWVWATCAVWHIGTHLVAAEISLLFQERGRVEVFALYVLEVAVGANFELHSGVFVANEDGFAVHL